VKGHIVPRGVGNRVTKRTIIRRMANLRSKRFEINGVKVKLLLCSSCLKRIKKDARDAQAKVLAAQVAAK
jgi:ribosomal protein L28